MMSNIRQFAFRKPPFGATLVPAVGITLVLLLTLVGIAAAAPPVIDDQTFSVVENSATGTFVGDVGPDTYTYSITAGNSSGAFAINPATGDITVADGSQINYEVTTQFVLTVQATNAEGSDTATITIDVINVNDAPVITPGQAFSVAENSPAGTSVGTVIATDPDPGNILTYSIVGGNTNNAFTINASTGEIQVQTSSALNYETTPTFDLLVSVTDGGLSDTETVTINLSDVNDPPVAVDDSGYTMAENTTLNGATPSVLANDTDEDGDALTAVLAAGPANGSVVLDSAGVFTYTPNLNFNGVDTFTYYANDGQTDSLNAATVTITVTGVNDPPTANDDTFGPTNADTVLNVAAPGVLGNDSDPENDPLAVASFANPSAQGAAVSVNGDGSFSYDPTGTAVLQALPQGSVVIDTFTYVITDGVNLSAAATVSVTVTGVNDPPTAIALDNNSVAENSPAGTAVGNFSATDPDSGDTFTYALVAGAGDTGNGSFQIVGNELQTAVVLDFETQSSYSIRVRVTDSGGLTFETTFTINVTNVNEAPTAIALDNNSVAENSPAGTAVGNFSATDQDAGDTFVYSLVAGPGSTDNGSFQIVGNELQTNAVFDYEAQNSYSIRVRVTDAGGLTFETTFTINVTNVNEAPTAIALDNNTVLEEQAAGAAVGNFSTTDPDNGDSFTYTLVAGVGDTGNSAFQIVGNELQTVVVLDFETQSSYSIRVRSTDSGGLWFEQTFTITVIDGNDPPTDITLSNNTVDENQPPGTVVGALSGTDPNAGDTLTFSLVPGAVDNSSFAVNGTNLETNASFDYEVKNSYTVRVRVTDQGGLSYEKDFVITINNVNDAPTGISLDNASIAENNPAGTAVGNFSATDQDAGDTFVYSLVAGPGSTDNASFQIVGDQLQTNAVFDYETQSSYSIRVRVTDAGGLTFETTFTINVTDVNEAPTAIALDNNSVAENSPVGTAVGNFSATDPDSGDTFTYALVAGVGDTGNGSFQIVGNQLQTAAILDFEAQNSYSIRVQVTDSGGLTFETTFTINVTDVNEPPVAVDDPGYTTMEDTPLNGTSVLGNDTDPENDPLTVATYTQPANGTVTVDGSGVFTYTPNTNFNGVDTFTYYANDGQTNSLNAATVTITVTGTNDPPIAAHDSYTTTEDTPLNGASVLANDTDPENDPLTATLVDTASNGTLSLDSSGTFVYTPTLNFNGVVTFTYQASDGVLTSSLATVVITVTPVNDPPVAVDDPGYTTMEDTPLNGASLLGNDTDPENDPLTVATYTQPANGTVTVDGSGVFTYTPNTNFNGVDTFTYYANDGQTDSLDAATVTITVTAVNDPPTADAGSDQNVTIGAPVMLDGSASSDPEGDLPLSYRWTQTGGPAVALSDPTAVTTTFTAPISYTVLTFTLTVTDSLGLADPTPDSVVITVDNQAPAAADDIATTPEHTPVTIAVLLNDSDPNGDPLGVLSLDTTATLGLVTDNGDGTLTYDPNGQFDYLAAGESATDVFTYTVSDGKGGTTTATVTITVIGITYYYFPFFPVQSGAP